MSGRLDWQKNSKERKAVENGWESVDGHFQSPGIGRPKRPSARDQEEVVIVRSSRTAAPKPANVQRSKTAAEVAAALPRTTPAAGLIRKPKAKTAGEKHRNKLMARRAQKLAAKKLKAELRAKSKQAATSTSKPAPPGAGKVASDQPVGSTRPSPTGMAAAYKPRIPRVPSRGETVILSSKRANAGIVVEVKTAAGRRIIVPTTKAGRPPAPIVKPPSEG